MELNQIKIIFDSIINGIYSLGNKEIIFRQLDLLQNWVNRLNNSIANQSPIEGVLNPMNNFQNSENSGPNSINTTISNNSIIPDIINNNEELTQFIESTNNQATAQSILLEVIDILL